MIKIIIIDDEEETRMGIIESINWKRLDIKVCGEAINGTQGLELARQVEPDIILADIRMPRMNGIEFANEVRNSYPKCKIIFMSGYTDKEYMKSAIRLKAIDYIEKPIDIDELEGAIKKAAVLCREEERQKSQKDEMKSHYEKSKMYTKQELALQLMHRNTDIKTVNSVLETHGLELPLNEYYTSILLKFNLHKAEILESSIYAKKVDILEVIDRCLRPLTDHFLSCLIDGEHAVIHIYGNIAHNNGLLRKISDDMKQNINHMFSCKGFVTIGVGRPVRGVENVSDSYQKARRAMEKKFLYGYDSIIFHDETNMESEWKEENLSDKIVESIRENDIERAVSLLDEWVQDIKKAGYTEVNDIKNIFLSIIVQITSIMKERGIEEESGLERQDVSWAGILNTYVLDEVKEFIVSKLNYLSRSLDEQKGKSKKVVAAVQYIKEHYNEKLTVASIADSIYLAPTYLCLLFKKELGKTINDFIEETRIEKSKEFLKNTEMKLNEISQLVGYKNANYFSAVFKKITGQYPSDYRRKFL